MPKNYSKSKIYKLEPICDHDEEDVYIGSTTQNYISHRLAEHVRGYNNWKNEKYPFISSYSLFEKYGIDRIRIILLETYPCINNDELRAREAYYQKSMKCVNKYIACRSKEEYLEYHKQYNEDNRCEILEKKKQYYQTHREEFLEKHKKYHQEHRDELLKQMKQYREEHKQEILEKGKEKITCECGREVRKHGLPRHQTTNIHKELMLQLTKEK